MCIRDSADTFKVSVRGELHLSILIETMRREGFELQVGKPEVIYKEINGQTCEPLEYLTIDVPQEFMGTVMESLGTRKAELSNMTELSGYLRMEFLIPARGLIGFRSEFLTNTKGNGIMYHVFHGYVPYKGDIPGRTRGALVAFEQGETTGYGIYSLQDLSLIHISKNAARTLRSRRRNKLFTRKRASKMNLPVARNAVRRERHREAVPRTSSARCSIRFAASAVARRKFQMCIRDRLNGLSSTMRICFIRFAPPSASKIALLNAY